MRGGGLIDGHRPTVGAGSRADSPVSALPRAVLYETHADFLRLAPDDLAGSRHGFRLDHQHEMLIGEPRTLNLKACAGFREIADEAIDPDASLEIDPAALKGARPWLLTLLVHTRILSCSNYVEVKSPTSCSSFVQITDNNRSRR